METVTVTPPLTPPSSQLSSNEETELRLEGSNGNWELMSKGGVFKNNNNCNKSCVNVNVTKEVFETQKHVQTSAHASKAQVVGWPPIRSYPKNTVACNSTKSACADKQGDDDEKSGGSSCCLYVKVGMDGAPYLRKVDLRTYRNYLEFSNALEKMFSCFTIGNLSHIICPEQVLVTSFPIDCDNPSNVAAKNNDFYVLSEQIHLLGQCGANGLPGRDGLNLNDSKLMDLLHGSDYVLTYEDKDGDWMLVGDVPWRTEDHERFRGNWASSKSHREMQEPKLADAYHERRNSKKHNSSLEFSSRTILCIWLVF
ncbi:hypothetical protein ACFE04_008485 [Oxalis oulophora]